MSDITMVIGTRIWDSILASAYGTDTLIAEHMRSALFSGVPIEMNLGRGRQVTAIADCWLDLQTWLGRNSRHGRDADAETRRVFGSWADLARRIDKEIAKLGAHPAFKGLAVMGIDRTVLSAWRCGKKFYPTARDAILSQTGCAHPEYGYLVPSICVIRNRTLTRWEFTTSDSAVQ